MCKACKNCADLCKITNKVNWKRLIYRSFFIKQILSEKNVHYAILLKKKIFFLVDYYVGHHINVGSNWEPVKFLQNTQNE